MKRHIRIGLVTGLLVAAGIVHAADMVTEAEINHGIGYAQKVDASSGKVTVSAALGNGTVGAPVVSDLDYYTFYAVEGDVVTLDIDGGIGGTRSVDTELAVFGPGPEYKMERMNVDAETVDEGSTSKADAYIENFKIPASGYYTVGVSNYPRHFATGGSVSAGTARNGDYKLVITGVTPPVQQINIEVKPGHEGLAPLNPKSKGKVPVALLSSSQFDALAVDMASLTFGATGDESSLSHCGKDGQDVNADGRQDLVCHFENDLGGFKKGNVEGILRGKMKWGSQIEGRALLKVVPEKQAGIE